MNTKTLTKMIISFVATAPMLAFAQNNVIGWLQRIDDILRFIVPLLMVLATIVFLWGVILYVVAGGDEEKVNRAKGFILTGLVGLFAMVAVWGIVRGLVSTFGVGGQGTPSGPGGL